VPYGLVFQVYRHDSYLSLLLLEFCHSERSEVADGHGFTVSGAGCCYFDKNDLITQFAQRNKLNQMNQDKEYFIEEIKRNAKIMNDLETNPEALERFARERYFMKKADEDLFVVTTQLD